MQSSICQTKKEVRFPQAGFHSTMREGYQSGHAPIQGHREFKCTPARLNSSLKGLPQQGGLGLHATLHFSSHAWL
jgi:hypothetical protein